MNIKARIGRARARLSPPAFTEVRVVFDGDPEPEGPAVIVVDLRKPNGIVRDPHTAPLNR